MKRSLPGLAHSWLSVALLFNNNIQIIKVSDDPNLRTPQKHETAISSLLINWSDIFAIHSCTYFNCSHLCVRLRCTCSLSFATSEGIYSSSVFITNLHICFGIHVFDETKKILCLDFRNFSVETSFWDFFFFFLNCVVRILRGVLDWQFKFRSKKKYKQYDTLLYAKRSNVMRCILFLIGIAVQILLQNVDDTYSLN